MERTSISHRQQFKKSHTCGSLFANCNCSILTGNDTNQKPVKYVQSYSHPDTSYIFTDQNRVPSYTRNSAYKNRNSRISDAKRLSSPNIGDYSILDVDVHPEVVLTVSHTNGEIQPLYADTKRDKSTPYCKKSLNVIRSELAKTTSDQSLNKSRNSRDEDTQDENRNHIGYSACDDGNRRKISGNEFKISSNNKSLDSATAVFEAVKCCENDLNSNCSNSSSSTSSVTGFSHTGGRKKKVS